jgi:hypothetical protein
MLAMTPSDAERAMLLPDGEGPTLRQNIPFGFLLRDFDGMNLSFTCSAKGKIWIPIGLLLIFL